MSIASKKPYYTINLSAVQANYIDFFNAIREYGRKDIIAYSIKANYDAQILKTLVESGAHLEVCSGFEYDLAAKAAKTTEKIIINGFQPETDLFLQRLKDGAHVIIGSTHELEYVKSIQHPIRLGLRLNLDYIKKGNRYFMKYSRFGVSPSDPALRDVLSNTNVHITCLQCHFAGNTRAPEIYYAIVKELCQVIKCLGMKDVKMIDIGGGYKVGNQFWEFSDYVREVVKALHDSNYEQLTIIYEPGNSIVRNACSYHVSVIDVMQRDGFRDILVNGTKYHCGSGLRDLAHSIRIENKATRSACKEVQRITGCTCKESDIICELVDFPEIQKDDKLLISDLGAYTINEIPLFLLQAPERYYVYDTAKNEHAL